GSAARAEATVTSAPRAANASSAALTTVTSAAWPSGGATSRNEVSQELTVTQGQGPILKRLLVPHLSPGQYILRVRGPAGTYEVLFVPPDLDGDGIVDSLDNCPETAGTSQVDADHDYRGDECDCADSDPTTWAVPAEVTGLMVDRSDVGPNHVELSWNSLTAGAGTTTVYDVITGTL